MAMATRPPRPSLNPPSAPLPSLPVPKTRKKSNSSIASIPTSETNRLSSASPQSGIPTSKGTSPSTSGIPAPGLTPKSTPHAYSTSSIPTLGNNKNEQATPVIGTTSVPGKTVRKTISIGSFPQPPKGVSRLSSLPTSPLAMNAKFPDQTPAIPEHSSTENKRLQTPKAKKTRVSGGITPHAPPLRIPGSAPSLLNGTGDSKSISSAQGAQGSEGLLSLPSPPDSTSSSMDGSYSTNATQFEDIDEDVTISSDAQYAEGQKLDRNSGQKDGKGNVLVSVRVRPDVGPSDARIQGEWMVDGRRSLVSYKGKEGGEYYYDNVFTTHDHNAKVYDSAAKRLVRRVMEGYHGTVFAYGMTGTGKTFSMQGTTTSPGVIPLAITDIFSYIRETPHREFLLRVSYLEIYNEKIHDLLAMPTGGSLGGPGTPQQEEIKLREDKKRGVYATPLKEEIVQSPTQLLRVIARGDHARRTSSTQWNARSSRSHAVVQIVVESRERNVGGGALDNRRKAIVPGGVLVSTLSLIDLAGSERAAESKERRTEGAHINKSLLTLGTVIAKLSGDKDKQGNPTDKDGKHLPYRDSKLTRLLQPALSGNSLVSILCTIQIGGSTSIALANSHTVETLNTLKFASRAKNNIVSHAKKAEEAHGGGGDAGSRALLDRYRVEISDLRRQLEEQHKAKEQSKDEEEEKQREAEEQARHEEQMLEMQLARTALKERIEHLNRLILSSKSIGVNSMNNYANAGRSFSSLSMIKRSSVRSNGTTRTSGSAQQPLSSRSSSSHTTVDAALSHPGAPNRAHSTGSLGFASDRSRASLGRSTASLPVGSSGTAVSISHSHSHSHSQGPDPHDEETSSIGSNGEGIASSAAHIRALQADLADKNRYISTLEKRLLQARRSSHSRLSAGFSPHARRVSEESGGAASEALGIDSLLREKDAEIAELRSRLDDKERMLAALRSAARKRDVADLASAETASPSAASGGESRRASTLWGGAAAAGELRRNASTTSNTNPLTLARASSASAGSFSAAAAQGQGQGGRASALGHASIGPPPATAPLSPVGLQGEGNGATAAAAAAAGQKKGGKSVDEMTRILDRMIRDRVGIAGRGRDSVIPEEHGNFLEGEKLVMS
ncbi:kinesin-domain-containing protein [Viridothelium virens]|uniref:Kinesin-like protein KIP2 n=1 Tax=Viridothelium virens TaxID=1048519 RepID=A0A6A6HIK0_VIRVR|nr:kinesin-domain-containing protein [Viridothelium virens]